MPCCPVASLTFRANCLQQLAEKAPNKNEQRIVIKFMCKEGKSAKTIDDSLVAVHGRDALSRSTVQRWVLRFQNSDEVKDLPRSGRPSRSPATVAAVAAFIAQDKRHTIRQTSAHCQVSTGLVHKILHSDLHLKKRPSKWIPHLNADQRERRVDRAMEALSVLDHEHEDIHIDHLITEDESWFWVWDPASKQANAQWLSAEEDRPQVAHTERSTKKTMLVMFFDHLGMVYHEWVPDGRGIGSLVY